MFARAVLPIAVAILIGAALPAQDAKKDLEKMQGEWTIVSVEQGGKKKAPDEEFKKLKLTITGEEWKVRSGDEEKIKMTFKIDPSKDPKTIDLTIKSGGKVSRGIYKLEGDTLTVCRTFADAERPKEFKTPAGEQAAAGQLIVWKRAKE
jgi:uncharacterized protein (TIGR03067 family)